MASIHDRYERLLEAGLVLAADLSLPATLQRIVELAADLTGARYGALGVLGRDGVITEFITTGVTAAERAAIGHIPVGRGILGVLIDDARPLRLHDIAEDPRSVGLPPHHPPMRTFLGVPVKAGGRVYGNLYLTEKDGGEDFDADDERALTLLAAQAGRPSRPPTCTSRRPTGRSGWRPSGPSAPPSWPGPTPASCSG
jgi:GAF domain-containing protein